MLDDNSLSYQQALGNAINPIWIGILDTPIWIGGGVNFDPPLTFRKNAPIGLKFSKFM